MYLVGGCKFKTKPTIVPRLSFADWCRRQISSFTGSTVTCDSSLTYAALVDKEIAILLGELELDWYWFLVQSF